MKIAVIGAGFTGLACAYELLKKGHNVTIFEKDNKPGGLAVGFKYPDWEWSMEQHYHHLFTNDKSILSLAKELNHEVIIKRPKTSIFTKDKIYQLDSPSSLLVLPGLSIIDKLRMAVILAFFRYNPFWTPLEKIKTSKFLPKAMGQKPYEKIWEPLLDSKFGKYKDDVSLAWFWARINKRTTSLAYPKGGFLHFAESILKKIEKMGGRILFNSEVTEISKDKHIKVKYKSNNNIKLKHDNFDKAIVTLNSYLFTKITPQLPKDYKKKLLDLKGLAALNLIIRLKKPFITDGTYWISICDKEFPFLAIVEHTNFMDKKNYNNEHLLYLGNYLHYSHPYMKMSSKKLLKIFDPFLKRINPDYSSSVISSSLFKAQFAQPIIPTNYSKVIPGFKTPLKNIYLANIQQVYPWDRGTNYSVELGQKVARLID